MSKEELREDRRRHLIGVMRKLKIEGIGDNFSIADLKVMYLRYKEERNRLVLKTEHVSVVGEIDKKWVMDRIIKFSLKTAIKKTSSGLIPPMTYMEIIQSDIFALSVRSGIVGIVLNKGGKFNYNAKTGKLIQ